MKSSEFLVLSFEFPPAPPEDCCLDERKLKTHNSILNTHEDVS
jgi:hypothetical protein